MLIDVVLRHRGRCLLCATLYGSLRSIHRSNTPLSRCRSHVPLCVDVCVQATRVQPNQIWRVEMFIHHSGKSNRNDHKYFCSPSPSEKLARHEGEIRFIYTLQFSRKRSQWKEDSSISPLNTYSASNIGEISNCCERFQMYVCVYVGEELGSVVIHSTAPFMIHIVRFIPSSGRTCALCRASILQPSSHGAGFQEDCVGRRFLLIVS